MKKIVTIVVLALMATATYAQKGSAYIGGAVAFGGDQWKVGPEIGTWLKDDIQLGAVLSFGGSDMEGTKTTDIAPHLYIRKWWPVGEKFSLYAGLNARYVSSKYETGGTSTTTDYFDAFLDAGFAYAVAERWGIVGRVGSLGYIQEDFKLDFNMSPQSLFNVGIYYTFKQ
ncbi:outer membrane beta-barrel protein [Algoriphagus terrigena]|uniref:outer membrane beta-barrel protein n=1 Tax=Algoriphagus terrigena TaxID=344884 RepID=UPI00146FA6E6|nr:outer membrane beta-barrel protein [Algoriphagus terrigena]